LGRQCGIEGLRLQAELGGQAAYPLATFQPPQKSMMSSRSFAKEATDLAVLEDAISYHTRQISNDLAAQGQQAVAIRVMAYPSRYSDYFLQGLSLEAVFTVPTADLFTLTREALRLLRSGFRAGVPYKKAGVSISSTMQKEAATPSLFAADTNQLEALNLTIATLTKKHGRGCVELGRVLNRSHGWQANTGALSPAYTTAWSDLKTVKA
jgi:DNA polymerase V